MSVSRRNQGVMNLKRRLISWIKMPASGLVGAVTRGSHGPLYLLSLLATVLFLVFCLPPLLQRRKCPDNVEKYPLFVEKNGLGE